MTYTILASLFDIGFGLFHLAFWRLFGWPATLVGSGKINAAVTQTLISDSWGGRFFIYATPPVARRSTSAASQSRRPFGSLTGRIPIQ